MKVLVTGGSGFIGQHVIRALRDAGYHTIQCDRRAKCPISKGIVLADMTRSDHVLEVVGMADAVIHLAGLLGTQEMVDNPYPAVHTNILGGLNVLQAIRKWHVPACFISLGNHMMDNTYSITKSTVERFVNMYNTEHETRVNMVRAMNAYGPGQKAPIPYGESRVRKIAPTFICKALRGEPIEVYGDGNQISDMVYVTDVAKALVRGMELAEDGKILPAIEVGPIEHNTVLGVAKLVCELTKSKSEIVHLPRRPGENPAIPVMADLESMAAAGIDPGEFVTIYNGLLQTIDFFR